MRFQTKEVQEVPTTLIVTAEEFVSHARLNGITVNRQPSLLSRELKAATTYCELETRRAFLTQRWRAVYVPDSLGSGFAVVTAASYEDGDNFRRNNVTLQGTGMTSLGGGQCLLPGGRIHEIESVVQGDGTAIAPADYTVLLDRLVLKVSAIAPVMITYKVGYGSSPEEVPNAVKEAILQKATLLYGDREGAGEGERALARMLANLTLPPVA